MKKIYTLSVLAFALFGFVSVASAQDLLTYNLKLGMRSDAQVAIMQNLLMSKGFLGSGNSTGNFGPLTFAAVRTYQGANGIDTTGFVGPLTRASMNAAISGGAATGGAVSLVPGCTSLIGYSPLSGVLCSSSQSANANTLTVGQVQVSGVSSNTAYLSSTYSAPVSSYYTVRFEYASNPTAFTYGSQAKIGQIILNGMSGSFSASLTNLVGGQTYYVRAVAEGGTYGTVASAPVSFVASGSYNAPAPTPTYQNQSTVQAGQPLVGTNAAYSVTENSAVISGSYDGRGADTSVYFQYWYGLSGITSTNAAVGGTGAGSATYNLSNLTPGMTYSYRVVAVNGYGTVYGTTMQVTTLPQSNNGYVYQNYNPNTNYSCTGVTPTLTGSLDSTSASGSIATSQTQVPLISVRLSSDCGTSIKSLSFSASPSSVFTSFSDFKMYIAGSSTPLPGTFVGSTYTFTTPIAVSGGGYTTLTLKANSPTTSGIGSVRVNLLMASAQSTAGVVSQYSTSVSGNTLTYSYTVIQNPGGYNGGNPVFNTGTGTVYGNVDTNPQ